MNSEKIFTMTNTDSDNLNTLFFDTYAFYRIYEGAENYLKYKDHKIVTTKLNLFEIYLAIFREYGEDDAEKFFNIIYPFINDFDENVIKEAAKLKNKLNKRDLSMTDCIGYMLSKQLGIKFLTGDKEFEYFDNVEFVK